MPGGPFAAPFATIRLEGVDHNHLARVMRAKPGDEVIVLNNEGETAVATVERTEKNFTLLEIACVVEPQTVGIAPEPSVQIAVAQALGKADKLETVIQHGAEAGATEFVPVRADRCVADLPADPDRAAEKLLRWNQISKSAAEQACLLRIPIVRVPLHSRQLFSAGDPEDALRLILHPGPAGQPLRTALEKVSGAPSKIVIAIGPEGGWSPAELDMASAAGWRMITLGPRVLRTETAALVAISQITYRFEQVQIQQRG